MCAKDKYAHHTVHICHIFHRHTGGMYVHLCLCCKYKVTNISPATRNTVRILCKLYLMLVTCITQHISLPHCSHCPHSVLAHRSNSGTYVCQNTTNNKIYFTCWYHSCSRNKYANQIAHICYIVDRHTWGKYVHICATYEITGINHVTRIAVHTQRWWQNHR